MSDEGQLKHLENIQALLEDIRWLLAIPIGIVAAIGTIEIVRWLW